MTNAERMKLIAAEARREKAEARALDAKIELAVSHNRLSGLVAERNRRRKSEVEAAVKKLVATGAVHPGDHFGQFRMTEQFIADPTLIILATTKRVYRAGPSQST